MALTNVETVEGADKGDVLLYALSTCHWCKKTRALLDELGVKYRYVYIDNLPVKVDPANVPVKRNNIASIDLAQVDDSFKVGISFSSEEIPPHTLKELPSGLVLEVGI